MMKCIGGMAMGHDGTTPEGDGSRASLRTTAGEADGASVGDRFPKELMHTLRFRWSTEASVRALWTRVRCRAKSSKLRTRMVYTLLDFVLLMIWTVLFALGILLSGGAEYGIGQHDSEPLDDKE